MTNEEQKIDWSSPEATKSLQAIEEETDSHSKLRKSTSSLTSLDGDSSSAVGGAPLSQLSGSGTEEASDGKKMSGCENNTEHNLDPTKKSVMDNNSTNTLIFEKEKIIGTSSPSLQVMFDGSAQKEADYSSGGASREKVYKNYVPGNPDLTTPAGEVSESACSKVAIVRWSPSEIIHTRALDSTGTKQLTQRTGSRPIEAASTVTPLVSTEDSKTPLLNAGTTKTVAATTVSSTKTAKTTSSSSTAKKVKIADSTTRTARAAEPESTTTTSQSQSGTTSNTSPGGVKEELGKVQVIRPCPVKTAPHLATAGTTVPAVQAAVSAAFVTPVPVTATIAEGGIQPRTEVKGGVQHQHQHQQVPIIREQQISSKQQQQVAKNKEVATNPQHKQLQQQQVKPSQTNKKTSSSTSASADEVTQRRERQQREKEAAKKRKESQCQFPNQYSAANHNHRGITTSSAGMGPQEGSGGPKGQQHHHSQQQQMQRQQYSNSGTNRGQGGGGGSHQDQASAYHHRSQQQQQQQQQQLRPGSSGASGVMANRRQGHGRTISTGSETGHSHSEREHASSLSSVPPTPLFERLVSEEVQELKSYARIIDTQNHRLADLERVHGDLEARLEGQNKERLALEKTLEERERFWSSQFAIMQKERDNWKNVVQQEQTKNSRLMDQVVRKDQDIHRMLQRKYDHQRSDKHDHSSIHSSLHHRESMRGGRPGALSSSGLDRSNTPPSDRGGQKVLDHHKSPHEILIASGSTEKVNERNVTNALEDFFSI